MIAASQVFKDAFQQAAPQILEPIHEVNILCADTVMGDVMGDLQSRRAMIMGMDAVGTRQKIQAKVPLSELYQYATALRSITQGKAKFDRSFSEFIPVTPAIKSSLVKTHQSQSEAA
jgi:elongation factor G